LFVYYKGIEIKADLAKKLGIIITAVGYAAKRGGEQVKVGPYLLLVKLFEY